MGQEAVSKKKTITLVTKQLLTIITRFNLEGSWLLIFVREIVFVMHCFLFNKIFHEILTKITLNFDAISKNRTDFLYAISPKTEQPITFLKK